MGKYLALILFCLMFMFAVFGCSSSPDVEFSVSTCDDWTCVSNETYARVVHYPNTMKYVGNRK